MAFYEAANRYLERGDATELVEVLDAGFVDHSAIEPQQDAAGLVRYLAAMRATYPDMRLEVTGMTPQDDRIAVAVATTGGTAAVARGLAADQDPSTPGYEQLRILDGKIAERWASQTLPPRYELAAAVELRHLAGWFVESTIEPLLIAPGASETRRHFSHSLLMTGSGTVFLEVEDRDSPDAPLLLSSQLAHPIELKRARRVELGAENVVVFPEGESFRVWNDGQDPASVTIVEIQYRPPNVTLINGVTVQNAPGSSGATHSLAGLLPMGIGTDDTYTLSLVRVTAAPNVPLPIHAVNGLEQLLVAEGAIVVELHAGNAAISRLNDRAIAVPGERRQLLPGEGLTAHSESLISYRVTGVDPATFWFVTIVSASDSAE